MALALLAVSPVFSNNKGGKGEGAKKEEPAEPQVEKKAEEPSLETMKSEGGLRQETPSSSKAAAVVKQSTTTPTSTKLSADLAAEGPEENASNSALSFNFVFYVMYKFNLSDI